jgi:hypothetical protein
MDAYPFTPVTFYIAPNGKDAWTGRLPEANAEETDGPLATIPGALAKIRAMRDRPRNPEVVDVVGAMHGPIVVYLRGGRYPIEKPVTITPEDCAPITFAAYPGEKPILDGGVRITDWEVTDVNGAPAWVADLPKVRSGEWNFRQLFVDGERRARPRLPKKGLHRMESVPGMPLPAGWGGGGYTKFVAAEGDAQEFRNLNEVEVVYVHFWIEERSNIADYDPASRLVTMTRKSRSSLVGSFGSQLADYYFDNVFEVLDTPGEWYLDRDAGKLYYLPMPGETPEDTEVYAPRALQLLRLVGDPNAEKLVEYIGFKGITFQHTDWRHPGETPEASLDPLSVDGKASGASISNFNRGDYASSGQAASDVPGVISVTGARDCLFEDCEIRNVGWYGMFLSCGCRGIRVVGNRFYDLGGGGIKLNGATPVAPKTSLTGWNRVTDNEIRAAGKVFHSGVGILVMNSAGNVVAHNHIHDLYYSGISVGWVWGYKDSSTYANLIEKNHIHHIGQGLLSDMGGVYLLGIQPGTIVRGNLIHDVEKAHYGGWALYTDEGSSHIVLENNVCYGTNGDVFHQHYGRENTVRNNILVCGDEATVAYTRVEPHVGVNFYRNIMVSAGAPMFRQFCSDDTRRIISDCNLYWDITRPEPLFCRKGEEELDFAAWQAVGHDANSKVGDPGFADIEARDFTLAEDSPALAMGFRPIDLSDVGIRPKEDRS